MRIGIDGRELLDHPTGVGRYLACLCAEWTASPAAAAHELVLYTPRPADAALAAIAAAAARRGGEVRGADRSRDGGGRGGARHRERGGEEARARGGDGRGGQRDGGGRGARAGGGARLTAVVVPGRGTVWWEQTALARAAAADRLDRFFGPGYSVPLRLAAPSVVALHDISFVTHPEWFGAREGLRRRWLARRSATAAAAVVTGSRFSRREILRHLDLDPARVHVVHNGVAPELAGGGAGDPDSGASAPGDGAPAPDGGTPGPDGGEPGPWPGRGAPAPPGGPRRAPGDDRPAARRDAAGALRAPGPEDAADRGPRPLVLYIGARFTRRHLPTLLAAFARVVDRAPAAELAIVGPDRAQPPEDLPGLADRLGIAARVTIRPWAPDADIAALYRRAGVFAWLSAYEGFGLPPLEALAAGTPVVAGDTPAAREILGAAARYVPVDDPAAVARALVELLTQARVRQALLARAPPVVARYTWARAAARTLAILETAGAPPR